MRQISMSMTTEAVRNRTKTVTRRLGWWSLKPGDLIQAVEKGMGLRKGEKVVKIAVIRVTRCTWEALGLMRVHGRVETAREGFPELSVSEFIQMFIAHNHIDELTLVNRIEFEYVDGEAPEECIGCTLRDQCLSEGWMECRRVVELP